MVFRCVKYLVEHKAQPMLKDRRGFTAFHYAVAGGNTAGLEVLLKSSSLPSLYSSDLPKLTPLHLAVCFIAIKYHTLIWIIFR